MSELIFRRIHPFHEERRLRLPTKQNSPNIRQTYLCLVAPDAALLTHVLCSSRPVAAGKPDPPSDCSLSQPTSRSVTLACTAAGYPGALPRHYVVEAYDALDGSLLRNVTNTTTHWLVDGLPPARNVTLLLYAANAKGRSAELRVLATTLQAPQPRTGATAGASRASMPLAGLLVPLLGTVSGLVVLAAVIVAILRLRGRGEGNDEKAGGRRRGAGGGSTAAGGGGGGAVSAEGGLRGVGEFSQDGGDRDSQQDNSKEDLIQRDEKDPDVIPYKTDLDYLDEDEKAFQYLHQTSTLRMRPSHGSAMGMGPGLGPGLAPSIQPLLASNLHADQSPGGLGRGLGQCGQQGLQSLQPNYQPDYQPEYQPDYQYQTGYQPVLQPVPVLQANGKPAMQPGPGMHTQVQGFGTLRRNPHHLHHLPHPVVEVTPPQPLLSQEVPPPRIYRDTKF
ncbi:Twitchin [Frankliniella fusca]|uniref:Twitchin n=1 Tax=Frankliniella fusca TaxID=407009 RepID=A0AAE1HKH4_9NEOP|nr:Twitchin [Frankliniella fusca]